MNDAPAKKIDMNVLKKLFRDAMALDDKVEAAKLAVEQATKDRSAAVEALFHANNDSNGPFTYKGRYMTIRQRELKEEDPNDANKKVGTGEITWFFVSLGDKATQSMD